MSHPVPVNEIYSSIVNNHPTAVCESQITKWDYRYLQIAEEVSTWSKDPSTKVGCCIIDEHNRPISFGYNGFPKGMIDSTERYVDRDYKIQHAVHAEMNAVLAAGRDLKGATVYITHPPCTMCLCMMKQAMVERIVCRDGGPEFFSRWCGTNISQLAQELDIELNMLPTISHPVPKHD